MRVSILVFDVPPMYDHAYVSCCFICLNPPLFSVRVSILVFDVPPMYNHVYVSLFSVTWDHHMLPSQVTKCVMKPL